MRAGYVRLGSENNELAYNAANIIHRNSEKYGWHRGDPEITCGIRCRDRRMVFKIDQGKNTDPAFTDILNELSQAGYKVIEVKTGKRSVVVR